MPLAELAPVVITGAQGGFLLAGVECPITKGELKRMVNKTKTTGSSSVGPDNLVYDDYGAGSHGWTFTWEAVWRVGANVTPPYVREGANYAAVLYTRRVGYNGAGDSGAFHSGVLLVESVDLTFKPDEGKWEWKGSGVGQGYLYYIGP